MRNKIKTILLFSTLMLCFQNLSAQQCRLEPEIKPGPFVLEGNSTILVPETIKSGLPLQEANEENARSVVQLEEALGGCTSVVFDHENKIIAINIPESTGLEPDALLRYFAENEEVVADGCDSLECMTEAVLDTLKDLLS